MAKPSKAHRAHSDPRPGLGRARPAGRARRHVGLRARHAAPGSTPPPSTSPSASPPTAASAGLRPNRSPRRWPPTNASIDTFVQLIGDAAPRSPRNRCRCSAWRRPAAAAISTRAAFPTGKGWDEMALPSPPDEHMPMRWRYPAIRCGPPIATATSSWCRRARAIRRGDRVVVKTTRRRGDGQGIEAPHREDAGTAVAQPGTRRTARWRPRTSRGSRGSCGRASSHLKTVL